MNCGCAASSPKSLAEHLDVRGQVAFFDEPVLPDSLHELVFFEQQPGVIEKYFERVEDFRRERNGLRIAQ